MFDDNKKSDKDKEDNFTPWRGLLIGCGVMLVLIVSVLFAYHVSRKDKQQEDFNNISMNRTWAPLYILSGNKPD